MGVIIIIIMAFTFRVTEVHTVEADCTNSFVYVIDLVSTQLLVWETLALDRE